MTRYARIDPPRRPTVLTLYVFWLGAGAIIGLLSLANVIQSLGGFDLSPQATDLLVLGVVSAIADLAAAIGLWQLKPWGRLLGIAVNLLHIMLNLYQVSLVGLRPQDVPQFVVAVIAILWLGANKRYFQRRPTAREVFGNLDAFSDLETLKAAQAAEANTSSAEAEE